MNTDILCIWVIDLDIIGNCLCELDRTGERCILNRSSFHLGTKFDNPFQIFQNHNQSVQSYTMATEPTTGNDNDSVGDTNGMNHNYQAYCHHQSTWCTNRNESKTDADNPYLAHISRIIKRSITIDFKNNDIK